MVVLDQITWTLWVFGEYPTTQTVLTLDQSIQLDGKEKVNENAFFSAYICSKSIWSKYSSIEVEGAGLAQ